MLVPFELGDKTVFVSYVPKPRGPNIAPKVAAKSTIYLAWPNGVPGTRPKLSAGRAFGALSHSKSGLTFAPLVPHIDIG